MKGCCDTIVVEFKKVERKVLICGNSEVEKVALKDNVAHLHEREAERVPAAPQQSLTLRHRFVIQSNAIYLGRRKRHWK